MIVLSINVLQLDLFRRLVLSVICFLFDNMINLVLYILMVLTYTQHFRYITYGLLRKQKSHIMISCWVYRNTTIVSIILVLCVKFLRTRWENNIALFKLNISGTFQIYRISLILRKHRSHIMISCWDCWNTFIVSILHVLVLRVKFFANKVENSIAFSKFNISGTLKHTNTYHVS